jgi:hypothetical protein
VFANTKMSVNIVCKQKIKAWDEGVQWACTHAHTHTHTHTHTHNTHTHTHTHTLPHTHTHTHTHTAGHLPSGLPKKVGSFAVVGEEKTRC